MPYCVMLSSNITGSLAFYNTIENIRDLLMGDD